MLNKIILMGRLTRDPELHRTQSGVPLAVFTLAVDRGYADQNGEKATDFIDCLALKHNGDFVNKYFSKGRMAVVEGRLQMKNWVDQNGNQRRDAQVLVENIYFGDSKRSESDT